MMDTLSQTPRGSTTGSAAAQTPTPAAGSAQPPPCVSTTTSVTGTSTTGTQAESGEKHSSGETSRIKKKQSDRLQSVKKRTLAVVIVADIVLIAALIYQLIWLNDSLHGSLEDRITDLMGFYRMRYNETLTHLALGANLYAINSNTAFACRALAGDADAKSENQRRLANDMLFRAIEIAVVTDTVGTVVSTGGPNAALGHVFNPQNIVTDFHSHYPQATDQVKCSVMVPRGDYLALYCPVLDAPGSYHPELPSWQNVTETLTRLVLTPLYCGTSTIQGYLIMGDAWTPRQYSKMNRLVTVTDSSIINVLARHTDGRWETQYRFNQPGQFGWAQPFADLLPSFDTAHLHDCYESGTVQTGTVTLGGIDYLYGVLPIQEQKLGWQSADLIKSVEGVMIFAEPMHAQSHTVNTALLWHVPFGVFMTILSLVTLQYTFAKFLNPMRLLIESVKKKKLKEFNDRIRQLKSSRSTIWALLSKTLLVQGVLLGLVFANRYLLVSSIENFTSAALQARIGPFVVATRSRAIASYLNAWTGFSSMATTLETSNITDSFRDFDFDLRFPVLGVDAMYLINENSTIVASSYRPSEGLVFPEIGIMEYFRTQPLQSLRTFMSVTSWHTAYVNRFLPKKRSLQDTPAFLRLIVAPVTPIVYNSTDDTLTNTSLLGSLVVVRVFNDLTSLWDSIVESFGTGYYGLFQWDPVNKRMASISTLRKTPESNDYTVDISQTRQDLLLTGIMTAFESGAGSILVQDGVEIQGQSDTLGLAPYASSDDVVLTPLMLNSYQVTAVPQDRYDQLLSRQLTIQATIMAIECLASLIALFCTYWPMKQFLDSLEKAFNVPSMSAEKRQRMEEKASAMIETTTKPDTVTSTVKKPDTSGVRVSVPSSVRRSV